MLGVPCSHYYAHNKQSFTRQLPSHLKGSDRSLALSLIHHKLKHGIFTILSNGSNEYGGISIDDFYTRGAFERPKAAREKLERFQRKGYFPQRNRWGISDEPKKRRIGLRLQYIGEEDEQAVEKEDLGYWYRHQGEEIHHEVHRCSDDAPYVRSKTFQERLAELGKRHERGIAAEYSAGSDVIVGHHPERTQFFEDGDEGRTFDKVT